MATTTLPATMADSTLNISTLRAPLQSSLAPSMADKLPALDFDFESLRAHMNAFTARFDEFIERGRRKVLEDRNRYRMDVANVFDNQKQAAASIGDLESQAAQHNTQLSAHQTEAAEMQTAIDALELQRDTHQSHVDSLKHKLADAKSALALRKAEVKERQSWLEGQRREDVRELDEWERALGVRIEGTGREDRVRFVFKLALPLRDDKGRSKSAALHETEAHETEASFELDMSGVVARRPYEVVSAQPSLAAQRDQIEDCVRDMCEREDLGAFLKGIRKLFISELSA